MQLWVLRQILLQVEDEIVKHVESCFSYRRRLHTCSYTSKVDNSEFVVGTECQKPKLVMLSKEKNAAIIAAVLFVG